jgi:hypothetical protein
METRSFNSLTYFSKKVEIAVEDPEISERGGWGGVGKSPPKQQKKFFNLGLKSCFTNISL